MSEHPPCPPRPRAPSPQLGTGAPAREAGLCPRPEFSFPPARPLRPLSPLLSPLSPSHPNPRAQTPPPVLLREPLAGWGVLAIGGGAHQVQMVLAAPPPPAGSLRPEAPRGCPRSTLLSASPSVTAGTPAGLGGLGQREQTAGWGWGASKLSSGSGTWFLGLSPATPSFRVHRAAGPVRHGRGGDLPRSPCLPPSGGLRCTGLPQPPAPELATGAGVACRRQGP